MKEIEILPGCISCGKCQAVCPQVFKVTDTAIVRQGADLEKYREEVEQAVKICPVNVIKVDE